MSDLIITPPSAWPVTVALARAHTYIGEGADELIVQHYIEAATDFAENILGQKLMPQVCERNLDSFPTCGDLRLGFTPVREIVQVRYLAPNGDSVIMPADSYVLDNKKSHAPHYLLPVGAWPSTMASANAVEIRYGAGYANAERIPTATRTAILLYVAEAYKNRELENFSDMGVKGRMVQMLSMYRVQP
jgi:uncharacterized phiE125 gp8 family phage protein